MSSTNSSDASIATPGTINKQITRFDEFIDGNHCYYETITHQEGFKGFSLEEHRLADYNQGKAGSLADVNTPLLTMPFMGLSNRSLGVDRKKLNLLRGGGIEIHVSTSTLSNAYNKWSLPIDLISYYSPFLKAACSWDLQKCKQRIELPDDDPTAFGLFVEWMYYGSYDISSPTSHPSMDAKCWVLGDKFLCSEFKNFAMSRLYEQHMATIFSRVITCDEVRYVCDNTTSASKLRQFYMDFVVENFANPSKLYGTTGDWDAFLQSCSDVRVLLLQNFRKDALMRIRVKNTKHYLESTDSHLKQPLKLNKGVVLLTRERDEAGNFSLGSSIDKNGIETAPGIIDALCAETRLVSVTGRGGLEDCLEA